MISRPATPTKRERETWTETQWNVFNARMQVFSEDQEEEEQNNPVRLRQRIGELERQVDIIAKILTGVIGGRVAGK